MICLLTVSNFCLPRFYYFLTFFLFVRTAPKIKPQKSIRFSVSLPNIHPFRSQTSIPSVHSSVRRSIPSIHFQPSIPPFAAPFRSQFIRPFIRLPLPSIHSSVHSSVRLSIPSIRPSMYSCISVGFQCSFSI